MKSVRRLNPYRWLDVFLAGLAAVIVAGFAISLVRLLLIAAEGGR